MSTFVEKLNSLRLITWDENEFQENNLATDLRHSVLVTWGLPALVHHLFFQ